MRHDSKGMLPATSSRIENRRNIRPTYTLLEPQKIGLPLVRYMKCARVSVGIEPRSSPVSRRQSIRFLAASRQGRHEFPRSLGTFAVGVSGEKRCQYSSARRDQRAACPPNMEIVWSAGTGSSSAVRARSLLPSAAIGNHRSIRRISEDIGLSFLVRRFGKQVPQSRQHASWVLAVHRHPEPVGCLFASHRLDAFCDRPHPIAAAHRCQCAKQQAQP